MPRKTSLTPAEKSLIGRMGAHKKWATTDDPAAATARARAAFMDTFDKLVPEAITDPVERARRAHHLRQAYFTRLSFLAAQARRKKAS